MSVVSLPFPDGPPVVAHYDISDTNSDPEVVNVDNLLAAAAVQEHNSSVANQDTGPTWRTRGLLEELSAEAGWYQYAVGSISLLSCSQQTHRGLLNNSTLPIPWNPAPSIYGT